MRLHAYVRGYTTFYESYVFTLIYSQRINTPYHTTRLYSGERCPPQSSQIFDSFFAPLPSFKVHDDVVYRKASAAASTKDEEPLRALKWEESESILQYGRMYLRSTILEKDNILCQRAAIPLRQTTDQNRNACDGPGPILHIFCQVNHTINRHLQHGQVETSLDLVHKGGTIMRTDYRWTFQPYNGTPVRPCRLQCWR